MIVLNHGMIPSLIDVYPYAGMDVEVATMRTKIIANQNAGILIPKNEINVVR
jgi:hypothetical protein